MDKDLLNEPTISQEENLSEIAEQILSQSLIEFRIQKLREEIDKSLQERNKEKFLELSKQLNELL